MAFLIQARNSMPRRILELFSGLGGWHFALAGRGEIAAAFDISPSANATYELNHGLKPVAVELASLPFERLVEHCADTWLMSPPCQPFCRMGNHHGLKDPRSRAFLHLLECFDHHPPKALVLENVEGFQGSDAHERLTHLLCRQGFDRIERLLCPSALGIPNQRPRFYLVASRDPLRHPPLPTAAPRAITAYLDKSEDTKLYLAEAVLAKHKPGLDLVHADSHRTACFIGGYGRRFVGSGSFLVTERGIRRFSPTEVARLLGLPESFHFPEGLPLEKRYKLLGNGLSIPVARWVLGHLANP